MKKVLFVLSLGLLSFIAIGQTISIADVTTQEGNPLTFNISLDQPSNVDTVIDIVTSGFTAYALEDYIDLYTTVTIPSGETSALATVSTISDNVGCEPNENMTIFANIMSGNTINDSCNATGTIIDMDSTPTFIISNITVNEGGVAVFNISLNHPCQVDTLIFISTSPITCSQADYTIFSGFATIPAYESSTSVYISTIQDNITEQNETFVLNGTVTSGNTANSNSVGTCTIISGCNIPTPTLTVQQPTCNIQFGSITLTNPVGGNYQYSIDGTNFQTSNVFTNLVPGIYTIQVNFINTNCNVFITAIINDSQNNSINASAIGTYQDTNSNSFVDVGDTIQYQYIVTNMGCNTLQNVEIYDNNNGFLTITGGPILVLNTGVTDATTLTSYHVITQAEINAGNVHLENGIFGLNYGIDVIVNTPLNTNDGIKFNAFIDTNGNGVQDSAEQNYTQGAFTYQINGGGINHIITSSTGIHYLYETNSSTIYNLSYSINQTNCASQYTIAVSSYININVATGSGITTYNFALTTAICADLLISISPYGAPPRPGFDYENLITYQNLGNQTITSGTILFNNDSVVTLLSYSQAGATVTPNGLTYNFTNLLPGETRTILVTMQVPTIPTVSLGQIVTNNASITPIDSYPANNFSSLTQVIVGSYDPNDKTESHGGKILHSTFTSNDYLTYTIQFENTGTAEAVNIRVNDVLDSKLNEASIRMVSASSPYVLERVGSTLNWKFNGINLPPSVANTQIGHGYITFQIKPKPGYAIGDIIPNFADIYFDYNAPITTNTASTTILNNLQNNNFTFNNFTFYPNPVQNSLKISNDSIIDSVEILSLLGQKMIAKNVNSLETELNLSELSSGIYFVKVTCLGFEKTIKVVKE